MNPAGKIPGASGLPESAAVLAASPVPWIGPPAFDGSDPRNRVLFTRFTRRRNFTGHPFWVTCTPETCAILTEVAREHAAAQKFGAPAHLADRSPEWRGVLRERDQLPERPVSFPGKRDFKMFWHGRETGEHALFGETEHWTRIRVRPGLFLTESDLENAEDGDGGPEFCQSPGRGFLTSNPGYAGAGLEIGIGLHLPGLTAARQTGQVQQAIGAMGFELRPLTLRLPGAAEAGFFLLLTRGGMNLSEEDLRTQSAVKVDSLLFAETRAMERWKTSEPRLFEDKAHRALRVLQEARSLDAAEFLQLASLARTGVYAEFFPVSLLASLEALRIQTRPLHVLVAHPDADSREENALRADFVRNMLSGI